MNALFVPTNVHFLIEFILLYLDKLIWDETFLETGHKHATVIVGSILTLGIVKYLIF